MDDNSPSQFSFFIIFGKSPYFWLVTHRARSLVMGIQKLYYATVEEFHTNSAGLVQKGVVNTVIVRG